MFDIKRGSRAASGRRRRSAFRIGAEGLEARELLAIDLANVATQPFGVQLAGLKPGGGAGFQVTDVGDVNGDGFDDFVVGGPTVTTGSNGATIANGPNSTAYLIFGSQQVTGAAISDWLALTPQQRIGDLNQLGFASQTNPTNNLAGFPFNGLTFSTGLNLNSNLGASVVALGDLNGDGLADFMIGAPGALNASGTGSGSGRAYIIYGSSTLATTGTKNVDLDTPSTVPSNVVTLVTNTGGALLGFSGAGLGDFFNNGFDDIAVGAPGAGAGAGAVFVISGAVLRSAATTTINVNTIGQTGGVSGVIFTGTNVGDQAGWSLAGPGDVDGAVATTGSTVKVDDLVIGAPQSGIGTGQAYLIYGGTNFATVAVTVGGVTTVPLGLVGGTASTNVPGAIFTGGLASLAGFAVSSAGDFNQDGFSDFLIGSPNAFNTSGVFGLGAAYLIEGAGALARPTGTIDLTNIPQSLQTVTFAGSTAGSLTGYSTTAVGDMNGDGINEIAIGAPGFNSEQGAVYLIPGNPDLGGVVSVSASQVFAQQIVVSNSVTPALLGASVSGVLLPTVNSRFTTDSDQLGDLVIGAPGYSLAIPGSNPPTSSRTTAGSVFVVEGKFAGLATPVSTAITTQIGVGAAFGPFSVNATTPAALQIFVFSNAAQNFAPVTQINPATISVNGVAFPSATVAQDPIDENGDGIPDAIVTITPRSALNLLNGQVTFTIAGRTTAAAGDRRFTGSATVNVSGSNGGGGNSGAFVGATQLATPATTFIPPNGSALIPTVASLSQFDSYQPLAQSVAFSQFLPNQGWLLRMEVFSGRISQKNPNIQRHQNPLPGHNNSGVRTLNAHVFTRDIYHPAKQVKFTHKVAVIPRNRQRNVFT